MPIDVNAVDRQGFSALHYAVAKCDNSLIQQLLRSGADPGLRTVTGGRRCISPQDYHYGGTRDL